MVGLVLILSSPTRHADMSPFRYRKPPRVLESLEAPASHTSAGGMVGYQEADGVAAVDILS